MGVYSKFIAFHFIISIYLSNEINQNISSNIINNSSKILDSTINNHIQINKNLNETNIHKKNNGNINSIDSSKLKELKIELYPENNPIGKLEKQPIKNFIPKDALGHSLDINKDLAFIRSNVPLLNGFYIAHIHHYPIRIKPDDIWLLIVQAFSNHVNANSEELRHYFVNFDGKKKLQINYAGIYYKENVNKEILEDFPIKINKKMIEYLGEEILETLTSNFTTTDYNSIIISKLSIMGAFKKYFDYHMLLPVCGIPYIILEGNVEDYIKIKKKAEKLSKYKFEWYINRIIPHIEKMIEAKKGIIDNNYFKNIIKKNEVDEFRSIGCARRPIKTKVDYVTGWILDFFAYKNNGERFSDKSLEVSNLNELAGQMLIVPFTIVEEITNKEYKMKYNVGFFGCDQNEKNEVFPVQGWIVSDCTEEKRDLYYDL